MGVWDTVGAYGIPLGFGLSSLARSFTYWTRGFRDTHFGTAVKLGLHAVAIDERRRPFAPTFWTLRRQNRGQAEGTPKYPSSRSGFAGVHSNIGGGYTDRGLSDLALVWMMAEVQKTHRPRFNEEEAMRQRVALLGRDALQKHQHQLVQPDQAGAASTAEAGRIVVPAFMRMLGFRRRRFHARQRDGCTGACGSGAVTPATIVDSV